MMHHEAGVRTVVIGGRPSYGPMQSASGSRGAASYTTTDLDNDIAYVQELEADTPNANFLPNRTQALSIYVTHASINLRDQVRKGQEVPLQFVYDAADCRIFWTPQTWYNYTYLWKYAADAIWTKPSLCVQNSTGYASTNATVTQAPPSEVLENPTSATLPSTVDVGGVILSMFTTSDSASGDTGISADFCARSQSGCTADGRKCSNANAATRKKIPRYYSCYTWNTCIDGVITSVTRLIPQCNSFDQTCSNNGNCELSQTLTSNLEKNDNVDYSFNANYPNYKIGNCNPTDTAALNSCGKGGVGLVSPGNSPVHPSSGSYYSK